MILHLNVKYQETELEFMADQKNTLNSDEDMRLVLSHTKIVRDFLQNEVPELFKDDEKV